MSCFFREKSEIAAEEKRAAIVLHSLGERGIHRSQEEESSGERGELSQRGRRKAKDDAPAGAAALAAALAADGGKLWRHRHGRLSNVRRAGRRRRGAA